MESRFTKQDVVLYNNVIRRIVDVKPALITETYRYIYILYETIGISEVLAYEHELSPVSTVVRRLGDI